jgi:hypothetical protein
VKPEVERRDIRSHVGATRYQVDRRNPGATTEVLPSAEPMRMAARAGQLRPLPGHGQPLAWSHRRGWNFVCTLLSRSASTWVYRCVVAMLA